MTQDRNETLDAEAFRLVAENVQLKANVEQLHATQATLEKHIIANDRLHKERAAMADEIESLREGRDTMGNLWANAKTEIERLKDSNRHARENEEMRHQIERLQTERDNAWQERDQYLEQNVKLKAEVERLRAALRAPCDDAEFGMKP